MVEVVATGATLSGEVEIHWATKGCGMRAKFRVRACVVCHQPILQTWGMYKPRTVHKGKCENKRYAQMKKQRRRANGF